MDIGSISINGFVTMRVLAIAATAFVFLWQWNEDPGLGTRRWKAALFVLTVTLLSGLLGARAWEVIRVEVFGGLVSSPLSLSQASSWYFAGFAITLLGATVALKVARVSTLKGLDYLAPGIAIGHALQRIGCFLAGDGCYGHATDLPWGIAFPNGSVPIDIPVHPTMLYEAALMAFLFVFLWSRRGSWPAGVSFALCVVVVGGTIFLIHFIHLAPKVVLGLTEAQLFSLFLVPFGLALLSKILLNEKTNPTWKGAL